MDHRMTLPKFTLKGSAFDVFDVNDPDALKKLVLTPNTRGQMVSVGGDLHRPEPIDVDLDEDGRINGGNGIQLLAALDSLDQPLQWNVQVVTDAGFPRQPRSFSFDAPAPGETVYLGDVAPVPLLSPTGITRGPRGVDDVALSEDTLSVHFTFQGEQVGADIPIFVQGIDCGEFGTARNGITIDGGSL